MTTSKIILATSLVLAALATTASAHGATRHVDMAMETFAERCVGQGGVFEAALPVLSCETASVRVDCTYFGSHEAECSWPGIDNRVAVNRLIGLGDASTISAEGGGPKKGGGGIKLPNLPIKW